MTARRPAVVAAALVLVLGVPGIAGADPDVPDGNLSAAVHGIDPASYVHGIDLSRFVQPLESEEVSGGRVTVRISADVLFDFNEATLTDAARRRIARLAARLRQATGTIEVSGHSDSVGEAAYNQALSTRRAEAVKAELERLMTGSAARVEATGHGETRPVAPNTSGGKDDPAGRAKNRRVDITFQKS
ncbi:OmpA family protein [Spirillospora sp. NPDC029432]|uniref:OmpA family protein n=1 Tax=Spirillospora sp. NPDC029432 TaxID=3154599 RepID=UPI003451AA27